MRRVTFLFSLFVLFAFSSFSIFVGFTVSRSRHILGTQTSSPRNCHIRYRLPDPVCTPGHFNPQLDLDAMCQKKEFHTQTSVSKEIAAQVFSAYGIPDYLYSSYAIDQLVSEQLGGTMDLSNLWPQPIDSRPGYSEKNRAESFLLSQVCNGNITLSAARDQLSKNWVAVFLSVY